MLWETLLPLFIILPWSRWACQFLTQLFSNPVILWRAVNLVYSVFFHLKLWFIQNGILKKIEHYTILSVQLYSVIIVLEIGGRKSKSRLYGARLQRFKEHVDIKAKQIAQGFGWRWGRAWMFLTPFNSNAVQCPAYRLTPTYWMIWTNLLQTCVR